MSNNTEHVTGESPVKTYLNRVVDGPQPPHIPTDEEVARLVLRNILIFVAAKMAMAVVINILVKKARNAS